MSYLRQFSGLQSKPQGRPITRGALGDFLTSPAPGRVRRKGPNWYLAMQGMGATAIEYSGSLPIASSPPPKTRGVVLGLANRQRLMASVRGTSLGDDTLATAIPAAPATTAPSSDAQWQAEMLDLQRKLVSEHALWAEGDVFYRRLAIAATISIPLFAAAWRLLGVGRKKKVV